MAAAFSASLFSSAVYENFADYDAFPSTEEAVVILGQTYILPFDRESLEEDVQSKIWFTYRKGFSAIGGTGPTSDVGWGCMLRCGQMMLGQALVNCHLTRDWRWKSGRCDVNYREILRLFQDKKDCCYSIHQIASMGASEGKAVGEWFGPNTVVQVLRKLAVYDRWSNLVIHVAMDNSVIIEDICKLCETSESIQSFSSNSVILSKFSSSESPKKHQSETVEHNIANGSPEKNPSTKANEKVTHNSSSTLGQSKRGWRPLLLVIPLRLGLSEINATYFNAVKACFQLKQSVGIIGGRPSHAHWFIGYTGDRLFYLDPHTVQPFVDLAKKDETDESFRCQFPCHLAISELDPSIAVGFYCGSREEFDDLCLNLNEKIVAGAKTQMFELHEKRPSHFPPVQPYCLDKISKKSSAAHDNLQTDTDDEYEIL